MRDGKLDGMQDFDTVIKGLIESKVVSLEDGLAFRDQSKQLAAVAQGHDRRGRFHSQGC